MNLNEGPRQLRHPRAHRQRAAGAVRDRARLLQRRPHAQPVLARGATLPGRQPHARLQLRLRDPHLPQRLLLLRPAHRPLEVRRHGDHARHHRPEVHNSSKIGLLLL